MLEGMTGQSSWSGRAAALMCARERGSESFVVCAQLEETASNLRRKQRHTQDGDEPDADLPDVQVLLYSSRQFGPSSIREITVGVPL